LPHARLTDADGAIGSEGTVRTLDARPGRFEFEVDAPQPAWLLVAEGFHRGWRATADGRPCEAQPLAGFVGVPVGAGRQRIGLEFRPPSLRRGRWLSLFGTGMLVVCLATTLAGGLRRRTIDTHESSTEVVR
jgi:uncharacterized membrane protein YfhO